MILMSPRCTPFGPFSNLNKVINRQGWESSYKLAAPHGRFCGEVALHQCRRRQKYNDDSCFVCEQPNPSNLYLEHPWPLVWQYDGVRLQAFHQCMTGRIGPSGLPAKKPTGLLSNESELLQSVEPFWCDGSHEHDKHCTGVALRELRLWTWTLAKALAGAVVRITRRARAKESSESSLAGAYPSYAHDDGSPQTCPGCNRHRAKDDPLHNRVRGECKYWNVESKIWTCPGCKKRLAATSPEHNQVHGECRFALKQPADMPPAEGTARIGSHPRVPGLPARRVSAEETSSSSSAPARQEINTDDTRDQPQRHLEPRPSDWTTFNIGASLQILRHGSPAACLRELRKLHLRWWHATVSQMTHTLRHAGLPQSILDACRDVVKTCRECRAWEVPGRVLQQTTTLSTYFNVNVETDNLFVYKYIINHFVDRCTRWRRRHYHIS